MSEEGAVDFLTEKIPGQNQLGRSLDATEPLSFFPFRE